MNRPKGQKDEVLIMARVFGRKNGRGHRVYLETVSLEDMVRLQAIKVYRTFVADYTNLEFEIV